MGKCPGATVFGSSARTGARQLGVGMHVMVGMALVHAAIATMISTLNMLLNVLDATSCTFRQIRAETFGVKEHMSPLQLLRPRR